MKFKKDKYYKCIEDFYTKKGLIFKKNKYYKLIKKYNYLNQCFFKGEQYTYLFSYKQILKLFNDTREEKFKRILNDTKLPELCYICCRRNINNKKVCKCGNIFKEYVNRQREIKLKKILNEI